MPVLRDTLNVDKAPICHTIGSDWILTLGCVLLTWSMALYKGLTIEMSSQIGLIFVSLCLMVSTKNTVLIALQRITTFYLFCIPLNQIRPHYLVVTWCNLKVSYALLLMGLIATVTILHAFFYRFKTFTNFKDDVLMQSWLGTFAVLCVHILVLLVMLRLFYGYGYERSPTVIGLVSQYFLYFLLFWQKFDQLASRRSVSAVTLLFAVFGF